MIANYTQNEKLRNRCHCFLLIKINFIKVRYQEVKKPMKNKINN